MFIGHLGVFLHEIPIQITYLLRYCIVCHFLIDFEVFFTYSGYQSYVNYLYCKYLLPLCEDISEKLNLMCPEHTASKVCHSFLRTHGKCPQGLPSCYANTTKPLDLTHPWPNTEH